MNNYEQQAIEEFRTATWEFWTPDSADTPQCIRCMAPAICLHEIDPKSMDREWYEHGPEDSVPVCHKCHEWAGEAGDAGQVELRHLATIRLQMLGDWKKGRVVREINI